MRRRPTVVVLAAVCSLAAAACEPPNERRPEPTGAPSTPSTPAPDAPVRIVAVGDIATDEAGDTATSDLAAALDPDWILTLGDNVYPDGTAEEFAAYYEPTWGRLKPITLPAPGNHEWHTEDAAGYAAYFGPAFPPRELVVHDDIAPGWDVYQVDTSLSLNRQVAMLDDLLSENADPCELVFGHHPRFSSGGHGDGPTIQRLWGALTRHGVELYLAGHDHDYERFEPMDSQGRPSADGTRQLVVGTGGAPTRPFDEAQATDGASEVRLSGRDYWGVLEMELTEAGYEGRFLEAGDEGGTQADAFGGSCA